jgi:hypothetical protein
VFFSGGKLKHCVAKAACVLFDEAACVAGKRFFIF